jgi:hypothetical protein
MNENNSVLAYQVVPNDTREHVVNMIQNIYQNQSAPIIPKAFFTDNVGGDTKQLSICFRALFPNDNILVLQVFTLIVTYLIGYLSCPNESYSPFTKSTS